MGERLDERGFRNPKIHLRADVAKCDTEATPPPALEIREFRSRRGHGTRPFRQQEGRRSAGEALPTAEGYRMHYSRAPPGTGGQPHGSHSACTTQRSRNDDQEFKGSCPSRNSHSFAQFPYLSQFHTQNLLSEDETSSPGRGGPSHHGKFLLSCRGCFSQSFSQQCNVGRVAAHILKILACRIHISFAVQVCVCVCVCSVAELYSDSETPWTLACQAPLSLGFFKQEILEWVAISSSRGSSRPRDGTPASCIFCVGRHALPQCHLGSPCPGTSNIALAPLLQWGVCSPGQDSAPSGSIGSQTPSTLVVISLVPECVIRLDLLLALGLRGKSCDSGEGQSETAETIPLP